MTAVLTRYIILVSLILHINCKVYNDRPKIKSRNGHLVIEPAQDKNIYFVTKGSQSSVFVGDVNLLNVSIATGSATQLQPTQFDDFEKYMNGPQGILHRVEILESQSTISSNDLIRNISLIWTRINRITTRLSNLQNRINNNGKDDCQSQTCQHGGTCLSLMNGYHCLCPSNWEGRNCEVDVNECRNFAGTDLGCQNGADCINKPGTYECRCRPGWYGLHCTRREKDCSGGNFEMCGHGTCVTSGDGIKCICDQGWTTNGTSAMCLTDVNECDSSLGIRCSVNPKVQCINLPGSFRCGQCPLGYEGDGYECSDIDECLTLPNGGCSPMVSCHNTIGSRICGPCPPGYIGDGITCSWRGSCSINRGGCHPSAQCIENLALGGQMSQCICPAGMDGDGIGLHGCYISTGNNSIQSCEGNPCGPHGQCHTLRTGYTCLCFRGFTGAHCNNIADSCAAKPCHNGGLCQPDDTTPAGFRCECTAQYTGTLCQVRARNCGGVLDAEEGSIMYPFTNTSYEHNSKCAWIIHTASNKVINITFSKFNLEFSSECQYDFLQIHDGRSSSDQLIGRFCGTEFPKGGNFLSSHNNLYFWFRSDTNVNKEGFALHWNSVDPICGGEINATVHGQISSPGSPGKYPPNRDCYWHLKTAYNKRIQLHFFQLDIEVHENCSFDYLAIYEGEHSTDPVINKYCSTIQPEPVQSAGPEMLIHFHSDSYGSGKGFQLTFAPVEGTPGCGGLFTAERGEIVSPSYNGKYLLDVLCEYKIKTSPDTKIQIEIQSFDLESSPRCKFDYLKIYDGPTSESRLYGRFCGKLQNAKVHIPKSFTSSSNSLLLKFRSDRTTAREGFRITYKTICQYTYYGDSGILKSPGYPFSYPENKVCEYIINVNPGKGVQLTFQDFDIEDNARVNCLYDHVEVRDGPNSNSTLLGRYCGQSAPPVQFSTQNFMYLKFHSDMSISGTGFYANYTSFDTECGGIYKATTGIISHPSDENATYKHMQTCTWLLVAPEGMHIKLSWNRFDIENAHACDSDYLELWEIDDNNKNETLGKYCGSTMPPALTTTTNRLMLQFVSDSSFAFEGFSFSYSFLDEKTHCGGNFAKSHGVIYSPGWPNPYEPNRDCTWVITVPSGQQIRLNISNFDLERPIRNKCDLGDYLEIRNGAATNSPLIHQYCGSFNWKRITSTSNSIRLRFFSDYYLSGNGFKIEWDGTIQGCGGTLTSSRGSISSPNYPENYKENSECFYRIVTSHGSRIRIKFNELDLEFTRNCADDHVEIFDGRDASSRSLGKYCKMTLGMATIETTTNYAFIKFRSDFFTNGKGFLLDYFTICNNNVTGSYGIIESPAFPGNYPLNSNCLWTINVPKGNKINVTFTHFDIYQPLLHYRRWWSSTMVPIQCDREYLQTIELNNNRISKKHCGSSIPSPVSTVANSLQIKFVSSYLYAAHSGFRLEWVSYGCGGHIQKRFGGLDKVLTTSDQLECEWVIETPLGTSVFLTFTKLYLTNTQNCTTDAIEIYNGPTTNSPLLSKICHDGSVTVQSSTNFLLVKLIKTSTLKDVHFKSQFTSTKSTCGGVINSPSGIITSKNFPKNYDNNLDCTWTISVPNNHRIEVEFTTFDLYSELIMYGGDTPSCDDLIKLYDETDMFTSNYTQMLCPDSKTRRFVSKSNTLLLQFITDNRGTAKGFKASFNMTCGSVITADTEGIITNNDFISHSNLSCTWVILAPKLDQKVFLTLTHLSLHANQSVAGKRCPSSYIKVFDGNDENAPLIDEYCDSKVPPTITSHGNALTLSLGTNEEKIVGHFSAHYTATTTACGGILTSEDGALASPNYPLPYPVSIDCEWTLKTSPGNRVFIIFETLDIEQSEECNNDYLEIREQNGGGKMLGTYCGNIVPTNTTSGSELYIKFHSDNNNPGKGFLIRYGFLVGNDITGLNSGEVASPLYPLPYNKPGDFGWRITSGNKIITLDVDKLIIHTHGEECSDNLSFYDGLNEEAPLLKQLCGVIQDKGEVIQTSSNAVYIKMTLQEPNSGAIFHLRWAQEDKIIESNAEKMNCGSNKTELVLPLHSVTIKSPNYPDNYDNNLNCEWVFKAQPGRHLSLHFIDFSIEETSSCFADTVSIFTSNLPAEWKPVKENVCERDAMPSSINATTYLKINFHSDTSMTNKGFQAIVKSLCGGNITELSGEIGIEETDFYNGVYQNELRCNWKVKVRPGRLIKVEFEKFEISNKENDCDTYVMLRNGDSVEAPLLANGKYCGYDHENRNNEIVTSSNNLYITYAGKSIRSSGKSQLFKLRYEEKSITCGTTSKLDNDHPWEIISSPNYPSVPDPYSECNWVFTGPPGEILMLDFIERFDLDSKEDCPTELVEVRDGSSEISPLKGRYCHGSPGTIKSSSNSMFIKYVTQLLEPNNGFKANVSIDVCGGTIRASDGEVSSPSYPHMMTLPIGTVCEWNIVGREMHTLMIKPQDINLPESESPCATKITVEEILPNNNTIIIIKTFCNEDPPDNSIIITSSNKITIKLHLGKSGVYTSISQFRGFRFTYNSSIASCGGRINEPEGYLMTPGYPRETSIQYCHWRISVPDKTRRITLEILDAGIEKHRIGIYNDLSFESPIVYFAKYDGSSGNTTFESSGNKLAFFIGNTVFRDGTHRFKARFSSNEPALCGGSLSGTAGELNSPALSQAYSCEWEHQLIPNIMLSSSVNRTLLITGNVNSSAIKPRCRYSDPKLYISGNLYGNKLSYQERICKGEISYRMPSTDLIFKAVKDKNSFLNFNLQWKLQPCGGFIHVGEEPKSILDIPDEPNDPLDCVWVIIVPPGNKAEIKLEGSFLLDCENEFINIRRTLGYRNQMLNIASYCKDKPQDSPLILPFSSIYVEYHSNVKNATKVKLTTKTTTDVCGGFLTTYDMFASPNYPHSYSSNLECIWEIKALMGFRVSLQFINRFVIEKTVNCTKDAVIIYDRKDEHYFEVARLCGRDLPSMFNSTNNRMRVVLRTDSDTNLDGFQAHWTPICGGSYNATSVEQYIYSPGYPSDYWPSMACNYKISGMGKKVLLKFLEFDLEGPYPSCENDNLTVSAQYQYNAFFGLYCGSDIPPSSHSYENIDITFKSDVYKQKKGFKISYSTYTCGGLIKDPQMVTHGPLDNYDDNMNCTWLIEAPKNKIVVLKFLYIDLEYTYECYSDRISAYEGLEINPDKRLALICGHDNTTTVLRSRGNTMTVEFITDAYTNFKGFKLYISFSYGEFVGCGGKINMTSLTTYTLKSPFIASLFVYENYLDCHWSVVAPEDYVIKIKFSSFHIAPCENLNQTALGYSKCDCDLLELRDGLNPDSLVIGTYCGHSLPPEIITSKNLLSIRLSTDGEDVSKGFEATLSIQRSLCGQTRYSISRTAQRIKSPGYDAGSIARGLRCTYHLVSELEQYSTVRLTVKNLDLQPGTTPTVCDKDKLIIESRTGSITNNKTIGKDYIMNRESNSFFQYQSQITNFFDLTSPQQFVLCGSNKSLDIYVPGSISINVQTAPDPTSKIYKGVELEIEYIPLCGRNYTELYGRIRNSYQNLDSESGDCYTLITAPENYTISVYFLSTVPDYWNGNVYVDVYDGNQITAKKLISIKTDFTDTTPAFSSGRYILLHNHYSGINQVSYDLNYLTTDKGQGCGGYIMNIQGVVTSPLYPNIYRHKKTCEWELETPQGTRLLLHFNVFDLGRDCDNNYLQLVDRSGAAVSSYCSETPADYTSTDNYVKIVFVTTMNNGGTGWVAAFLGLP